MTEQGVPVVTSPRLGHQALTRRITAVYGVTAVFFVHGMLFASWVAHIPQVKANLGISLGLLGVALLGAPIGSILAMSAAGYLVPRLGSRRLLRTGMIGYCLAGALLGVARDLVAFFLVFMLWGVFQGTLEVAMNTQGVAVESAQRRPVMPMFHGSWSLGALAGAGIGTAAVALGVSLTSQLLVLGVISLAALTILTSQLLTDDRDQPRSHFGRRTPAGPRLAHRSLADLVRNRSGRHALRRSRSRLVGRVPALIPTRFGRDTRARLHPLLTRHGDDQVRRHPPPCPMAQTSRAAQPHRARHRGIRSRAGRAQHGHHPHSVLLSRCGLRPGHTDHLQHRRRDDLSEPRQSRRPRLRDRLGRVRRRTTPDRSDRLGHIASFRPLDHPGAHRSHHRLDRSRPEHLRQDRAAPPGAPLRPARSQRRPDQRPVIVAIGLRRPAADRLRRSRRLELSSNLPRHRFCRAVRGRKRGLLRYIFHSSKFSLVLLRYQPEMEVGHPLHQRQEVDALDSCDSLDRRYEPMKNGTKLGTFGGRHFTEIQQMPPSYDDDRSWAGRLQWSVLGQEVLTFDDVATWERAVEEF